ncbi:MAG: galactokinase [Nocardioides sp.]
MRASARELSAGDPGSIAAALADRFGSAHGRPADAVYAAPGRVNLIGEHVDYNGGRCLPMTLPHACYVAVGRRDDDRVTLRSVQEDDGWSGTASCAGPGHVDGWVGYAAGVLWAMQQDGMSVGGLDLVVDGHVPLGAGLSSSAALECAVALAAAASAGLTIDDALRERLVRICMRAENEVVGAPTGGLDQSASLLGAPGQALLVDFASDARRSVPWHPEQAGLALLIVDTGVQHALDDGGYASRRGECDAAATRLGIHHLAQASPVDLDGLPEPLGARARHVVSEVARVDAAVAALYNGKWPEVADLFTRSHISLRDDFEVSCAELDAVVDVTLGQGALGARMTGVGFGGLAIALVPEDLVEVVVSAVADEFEASGWAPPGVVRVSTATRAGRIS